MRLKSMDGPLGVRNNNANNDILNSPKRINTLQNSNITTSNYSSTINNTNYNSNNSIKNDAITDLNNAATLNNANSLNSYNNHQQSSVVDDLQWCNSAQTQHNLVLLANNANNRNQLLNINNNLAASLRNASTTTATRRPSRSASSICSTESSPDDSIDFEVHGVSSNEATPQDEERAFASDSESSDEGNNCNSIKRPSKARGIVNPNYPGFQHLAHTLNYRIKAATSDTDLTDDDLELDSSTLNNYQTDTNNINNNNNNNNNEDYHIDSVNRLDSVENIQKVFYDKPVVVFDDDKVSTTEFEEESDSSNKSDKPLSSAADGATIQTDDVKTLSQSATHENIVGDFEQEIQQEFGRITKENNSIFDEPYELPEEEKNIIQDLKEAVEKLAKIADLPTPTAIYYNIEPNLGEPFQLAENKSKPEEEFKEVEQEIQKIVEEQEQKLQQENMDLLVESNLKELSNKIKDAFLSNGQENLVLEVMDHRARDSNKELEEIECTIKKIKSEILAEEEIEKFCKEEAMKEEKERDCWLSKHVIPRKKEKIEMNCPKSNAVKKRRDYNQQFGSLITFPRREMGARSRDNLNRRSVPMGRNDNKKRNNSEILGSFDVYNIETAMPKIDLDAIETHLRAAREEERRRRTDREEIRRRLAMGTEDEYYTDRPGRKPSLQSRLQSGMNLQICFMNENVSDTESPSSDSECPMTNPKQPKTNAIESPSPRNFNYNEKANNGPAVRPATLSIGQPLLQPVKEPMTETDFFARQARLQTEARMALAQAKEMARMQMEIERQKQKKSPITEMVRNSLEKVGIPFPEEKRRLSRQILTEMNVAQLQVIVNDLHTQIETLNENLVKFLMNRDDLHMEQDSMLVDIEDLTRYLGAKEQVLKEQNNGNLLSNTSISPPSPAPSSPLAALNSSVKPHLNRIASLVKK